MNKIINFLLSCLRNLSNAPRVLVAMLTAGLVLGASSATFAAAPSVDTIPENPMGTQISDTLSKIVTWVMTYGVPALGLAIVFGILVRVGFKWLRRVGTRAAG